MHGTGSLHGSWLPSVAELCVFEGEERLGPGGDGRDQPPGDREELLAEEQGGDDLRVQERTVAGAGIGLGLGDEGGAGHEPSGGHGGEQPKIGGGRREEIIGASGRALEPDGRFGQGGRGRAMLGSGPFLADPGGAWPRSTTSW